MSTTFGFPLTIVLALLCLDASATSSATLSALSASITLRTASTNDAERPKFLVNISVGSSMIFVLIDDVLPSFDFSEVGGSSSMRETFTTFLRSSEFLSGLTSSCAACWRLLISLFISSLDACCSFLASLS